MTSKAAWCRTRVQLPFMVSRADASGVGMRFDFNSRRGRMITRRTFTAGAATMLTAGHLSTRAMAATARLDLSTVEPYGNFHTHNVTAFDDAVKKHDEV